MIVSEPEEMLVEFLRVKLTDPAGRHSSSTQTFSGNDILVNFTLSPPAGLLRCIEHVKIAGALQKKYIDYTFDYELNRVTFMTAPPTGTNNVEIKYKYGTTSWIFPDKPLTSLTDISYPRISVVLISGRGEAMGCSENDTWDNLRFQIDSWSPINKFVTISGESVGEQQLVTYLTREIWQAIRDYWRTELMYAQMSVPEKVNEFPHDFDETTTLFRKMLEVEFRGSNIGG